MVVCSSLCSSCSHHTSCCIQTFLRELNASASNKRMADPTEGGSVYGRSEKLNIEEALENLASQVSGKQLMMGKIAHQFPQLKHTHGYR